MPEVPAPISYLGVLISQQSHTTCPSCDWTLEMVGTTSCSPWWQASHTWVGTSHPWLKQDIAKTITISFTINCSSTDRQHIYGSYHWLNNSNRVNNAQGQWSFFSFSPFQFFFATKNAINFVLTFPLMFRVQRQVVQCPRNSYPTEKNLEVRLCVCYEHI